MNGQVAALGSIPTGAAGAPSGRARPLIAGLLAMCGLTLLCAGLVLWDAVPVPARAAGWTSAIPTRQAFVLDHGAALRSSGARNRSTPRVAAAARKPHDLPLASSHNMRLALLELAAAQRGWPRRVSCKSTIEGFSPCNPHPAGSDDRIAQALFAPAFTSQGEVSGTVRRPGRPRRPTSPALLPVRSARGRYGDFPAIAATKSPSPCAQGEGLG